MLDLHCIIVVLTFCGLIPCLIRPGACFRENITEQCDLTTVTARGVERTVSRLTPPVRSSIGLCGYPVITYWTTSSNWNVNVSTSVIAISTLYTCFLSFTNCFSLIQLCTYSVFVLRVIQVIEGILPLWHQQIGPVNCIIFHCHLFHPLEKSKTSLQCSVMPV